MARQDTWLGAILVGIGYAIAMLMLLSFLAMYLYPRHLYDDQPGMTPEDWFGVALWGISLGVGALMAWRRRPLKTMK